MDFMRDKIRRLEKVDDERREVLGLYEQAKEILLDHGIKVEEEEVTDDSFYD
jgi:hypothetical protein